MTCELVASPPVAPAPVSFVGRESELAIIQSCANSVEAGTPWLVSIEGPPGIGKTALLQQATADLDGFEIFQARAAPPERTLAFGVVTQLVGDLESSPFADNRVLIAPLDGRGDAEVGRILYARLAGCALRGPITLVIDDLHHCDPQSCAALAFALRRISSGRVLVLVAVGPAAGETGARPIHRHPLVHASHHTQRLRLTGLSHQAVASLATEILAADVPERLVTQFHEATDGQPLRVIELLTEMNALGADLDNPFADPHRIPGVIAEEFEGLPPSSRALFDALVVLDRRCAISVPALVGEVEDPITAVEPLLAGGLVQWWPSDPVKPVEIRSSLHRAAGFALLGPKRRVALHLRAADVVDDEAAWHHRVAATAGVNPELAGELEAAADGLNDPGRRATYLMWSAALSATRDDRERRLLNAVLGQLWAGRLGHADVLRADVEHCAPSALRSCALGELALASCEFAAAKGHLLEAVRQSAEPEEQWLNARASASLAGAFAAMGRGAAAIDHAERALRDTNLDGAARRLCLGAKVAGQLFRDGPESAMQALTTFSRMADDEAEVADLTVWRAWMRMLAGHAVLALRDAAAACAGRGAAVIGPDERHPRSAMAFSQYLLGAWKDAATTAEEAIAARSAPFSAAALPARTIAAIVAAGTGDRDTAVRHIAYLERYVGRLGDDFRIYRALAEASLAQADEDHQRMITALEPITSSTRNGITGRALAWEGWWLPLHVEALLGVGELESAEQAHKRLVALAARMPHLQTVAGWLGGWLAENLYGWQQARVVYEDAAAQIGVYEAVPPLHRAQLEHAFGRLLHRARHRRSAINWLRRAQRRYVELHAQPFVQRCADELTACGLREAQTGGTGTQMFTEREQEVVALVVAGLTNQDAAARLFVSTKTIEYHLGNVYAKLGISSRDRLRAIALAAENGQR